MYRFLLALLLGASACTVGGYHVEAGPVGARPVFGQSIDILVVNDCAPLITYVTSGVPKGSIIGRLQYGQQTTIRLSRPLFAGSGSYNLVLLVRAYSSTDGSGYLGSTEHTWYVDSWTMGRPDVWQVNTITSPTWRACPRA